MRIIIFPFSFVLVSCATLLTPKNITVFVESKSIPMYVSCGKKEKIIPFKTPEIAIIPSNVDCKIVYQTSKYKTKSIPIKRNLNPAIIGHCGTPTVGWFFLPIDYFFGYYKIPVKKVIIIDSEVEEIEKGK